MTKASQMSELSPLIPPTPSAAEYKDASGKALENIFARTDPLGLFADWLAEAGEAEINDPNAVAVASVDADGLPDVRIVLLKDFGEAGFVFYSHRDGTKGRQMLANPKAAMCFHWKSLERQVRLRGPVETVEGAEADAYFASRARLSQIGAWASEQSAPLESWEALRGEVSRLDAEFGEDVARPADWHGFRVVPREIEFWRARPYRLHDRLLFVRENEGWSRTRLNP